MLTNLKELDLSMNLYTQMPDQLLWKDSHLATSLTKLSINQNRIQVIPDDIQEMKSLQVPFSARLFVWVRARARACVRVCGRAGVRASGRAGVQVCVSCVCVFCLCVCLRVSRCLVCVCVCVLCVRKKRESARMRDLCIRV